MEYQGFSITHEGSIVRVTKACTEDSAVFAHEVARAYAIVREFPRSAPGSDWGCDGVGFDCQRRKGLVEVMRSGVGPRKFAATAKRLGLK